MADDGSFDTNYATSLGSAGLAFGGVGGLVGAGLGLTLGGVKYLLGGAQRKQAASIHPYDPGYQLNNEVIDNARVAGDVYNNYQLPGQQEELNNIQGAASASFENARKGATSSADLLDAANKEQYQENQQLSGLQVQTAQGKQSALTQYLATKAASGAEYQNKNTYDREQYNQQLQLKNQLNNNATANQYSAADQAAKLVSSIFSYKSGIRPSGVTGNINAGEPLFSNGSNTLPLITKPFIT